MRQQIKLVDTKPTPTQPKFERTRVVLLREFVAEKLSDFLKSTEVLEAEGTLSPSVDVIILTFRERKPINKNYHNTTYWHPAIISAGLLRSRTNGTHALRHFCALTWLEYGLGIRAVVEYLNHSDPGFTLRIYTHLMPKIDANARDSFSNLE